MNDIRLIEPDELRRELAQAVAPLDPSPRSYNWLKDNIARRRRQRWLIGGTTAAAGALSLGVAALVFSAVTAPDSRVRKDRAADRPSELPWQKPPAIDGDIDGDGKVDEVGLHFATGSTAAPPSVHIRAVLTSGRTVEADSGFPSDKGHFIDGVVDIDQDGYAEVVVAVDQKGGSTFLAIARLVNGRFAFMQSEGATFVPTLELGTGQGEDGDSVGKRAAGWACADIDPSTSGREIVTRWVSWTAGGSFQASTAGYVLDKRGELLLLPHDFDVDPAADAVLPMETIPGGQGSKPLYLPKVSCGSLDGQP